MTSLLRRLFPSRPRPSRARRPAPAFRPGLTCLDCRDLPSITFHGGPLLTHVDVHNVFYGQSWPTHDSWGLQRYQLNQFQTNITKSPYMAMLGEYGVGRGGFGGYDEVDGTSAPADNTTVKEFQIQEMLATEINAGRLPQETGRQLYFVYLPPTVKSQFDQSNHFDAHHGSFQMRTWHSQATSLGFTAYTTTDTVYYAVVQHAQTTGTIGGLNDFQYLTELSSHELAEAVTDPDIRQSGTTTDWANSHLGWIDTDQWVSSGPPLFVLSKNPNYELEIGDLVEGQYANFYANGTTYTVQKEWSNFYGQGILANSTVSGLMDFPATIQIGGFTNPLYTNLRWTNGGRTAVYSGAFGVDGRVYLNFMTTASDYAGWFTIYP